MHDRSEWREFVKENTTVVRCHGDMKPLIGGSCSWPSLQLKGIKGKIFFYLLLSVFSWHVRADPTVVGRDAV